MRTKLALISSIIMILSACGPSVTEIKEKAIAREKVISDSITNIYQDKIEQDSLERAKKEQGNKYVNSITIADSLFFIQDFLNAKESYREALVFTNEENNKKIINSKIINCERKIEENSPIAKVERLLLGKHTFGVQFIWDGYGTSSITKEGELLKIEGKQYSKDKTEYTTINGTIKIVDERQFLFNGNLKIYTKDCCGIIDKTGEFTFKKTGKRKYWRLQGFNKLCSQYTCAYYLDVFE